MDGVGDYTRRLAAELIFQGHECRLLAISDHQVTEPTECDFGDAYAAIQALRLPARESWPFRLQRAMDYRTQFSPDWVSWQIVIYGFDKRGLSFGLGRRLREVSGRVPNHIMFHEIWIGEGDDAPLKHKLIGRLQRQIIKDVLRKLKPRHRPHEHAACISISLPKLGVPREHSPALRKYSRSRTRGSIPVG